MSGDRRRSLAVVGIGNPLAGDDGAGVAVVERLRRRWGGDPRVLLATIEGDLYAVADVLETASRLVVVDAVAGEPPGAIVVGQPAERALAPSFHQADIGSVIRSLAILGIAEPFPDWELWGITVVPPRELREGLSPAVEAAVGEVVDRLDRVIRAATDVSLEGGGGAVG